MSDEIPFHIQAEIIKRLPVVSLLRFRSISKAWKSLIESSDFIAAHSVTQQQHLLLKYDDPVETAEIYVSLVDDNDFPQQRSVHTLPDPDPESAKLLINLSIVDSSHGLLCLHGYYVEPDDTNTETVVLWNPSIRKSIAVTVPKKVNLDRETYLGFGVCRVTCDPKIVRITQIMKETRYHCEAKVYTLSSSKWTTLSTRNLKPFRIFWPQVVVDRFIYWCAFDPMARDLGSLNLNLIMSFDLTNENFGVVELPGNLRSHRPTQLCISKLRESLVILEYECFMKRACVVWMMESGVQKSFTRLFAVYGPDWSRTITILGFKKSGEPVMEVDYGHEFLDQTELVVYEPNIKCFTDLEIYGTTESFVVNSYMETLLLLGYSGCSSF